VEAMLDVVLAIYVRNLDRILLLPMGFSSVSLIKVWLSSNCSKITQPFLIQQRLGV
jgi:hypothetical protein